LEACHLSVGELFFHRSGTCIEIDEPTRGAGHVFGIHGGLAKPKHSGTTNIDERRWTVLEESGHDLAVRTFVNILFLGPSRI
jgi:hypothetical protein